MTFDPRNSSGIARWEIDRPLTGADLRAHPPYSHFYSSDSPESQSPTTDHQSAVKPSGRAGNQVLIALALATSLPFALSHAQQITASLLGTVSDVSEAAMPGVVVRVANLGTNLKRETVTDQAGTYSFAYLPSGVYQISASHKRFQPQQVDKVILQVDQTARLDSTMRVSGISETLNVSASGTLLETEDASVGMVIDGVMIVDLPLSGRNFVQLAQLIPGVEAGTPGSITVRRGRASMGQSDSAYGSTGTSANGARDTANRSTSTALRRWTTTP
jgi:hypothetical protein